MMAVLAFFQPFKHSDILSINTGAQMVVLLVLFAAMFLLLNGGGSSLVAIVLVASTLAPLVAGVVMTLRLPEDAYAREAGDALTKGLSAASLLQKFKFGNSFRKKATHSKARDLAAFTHDNPMHAESGSEKAEGRVVADAGEGEEHTDQYLSEVPL